MNEKVISLQFDTIIYEKLRRHLATPKCSFGKKFVEVLEDGTTRINFTPRMVRTAAILFAIASGVTVFIALFDWLTPYFGP